MPEMQSRLFRVAIPVLMLGAMACSAPADSTRRVVPSYDLFTGKLIQLSADQNGDGMLDQWTYLDGNRTLRGEADADGDGRIDRWEYFDRDGALTHFGSASQGDGVEDTWTFVTPQDGEIKIGRSRARDRLMDQVEFFRGDTLVRSEEDEDRDGRADRWERYEGTVLREAAFDTTGRGSADRRLLYDEKGRFEAIETDMDGDGTFTRLTGEELEKAKAGANQ